MSNTFKGTPGPWVFKSNIVSNDYETVAGLYGFDKNEKRANGILISHAPELLEMLQEVSKLQSDNYGNGSETHMKLSDLSKRLNALITRATTI